MYEIKYQLHMSITMERCDVCMTTVFVFSRSLVHTSSSISHLLEKINKTNKKSHSIHSVVKLEIKQNLFFMEKNVAT